VDTDYTTTTNTTATSTSTTTATISSCTEVLRAVEGQRVFTLLDKFIDLRASIDLCDSVSLASSVDWSWFQTIPTASSAWIDLQGNSLSLRATLASFNGVGSYDIRCTSQTYSQEVIFQIVINNIPPPIISLAAPEVASPQCNFVLDASRSEDPAGEILSFSWECVPLEQCNFTGASDPILEIPSGTLEQGEHTFVVVVSRGGADPQSATATATVNVSFDEGYKPSVALESPGIKVSAQVPLQLAATIAASLDCPAPAWRIWWLVNFNESQAWNLTLARENVPPSLFVRSLIGPSGDYIPAGTYFLRFVLSSSSSDVSSWRLRQDGTYFYDTRHFSINPRPSGGIVVVTPAHGTPISTTFDISTSNWQDDDIPLTYRIQQHVLQENAQIELFPLTEFSLISSAQRFFGTVENITVQGDAKDALGSVSSAFGVVMVREATEALNDVYMLDVLASVSSLADVSNTVSAISAIASYKANDKSLAGDLLNAIADTDALDDPTSEVIGTVASTLETVVAPSSGSSMNSSMTLGVAVADKAVDIASSVMQAAVNVEGGLPTSVARSIIGAGASILGTVAQGGNSNAGDDDNTAKKLLAPKLIKMMAADLPDAILLTVQEGESTTMERAGMLLTVAKLKSMRNESIQVGSIAIASLDSLLSSRQARRLESCSTHGISNAQWPRNPYGYAGNQTTYNESASNGSAVSDGTVVTECCEVQDDSVVTIEVRACGQTMVVQNLSEPIEFDVYAEGKRETIEHTYDPNLEYDELTISVEDVRSCQYWDTQMEAWSVEGCSVIAKYENRIRCSCTHLSSFTGSLGSKFGRFGSSNAALLLSPPKINFGHTPFQVTLLWFILVYTPCFLCCYKDRQDYKWLSQRTELFKDRIPRNTGDVLCMIFPGFRLCGGLIAVAPTFVNCRAYKRRTMWCLRGGCCRAARLAKNRFSADVKEDIKQLHELAAETLSTSGPTHSVHSSFIGSYGPEIGVEGAEPSMNQILWPITDPPLRKQVYTICTHAQEEITMASDQVGVAHKLTDNKNRAALHHSISAFRRFEWNEKPVVAPKNDETLGVGPLEMQVMNVKLCHMLVEHWTCREKKLEEKALVSKLNAVNAFNSIVYKKASQNADKKREILLQNLDDLLKQKQSFLVAPSPPPLHAMRVKVVAVSGTLVACDRDRDATCRYLGDEDAMLSPGQHMLMWICCKSGHLLIHEAYITICDVWNLVGMKRSIVVPLAKATETKVEVTQVETDADTNEYHFHNHSSDKQNYSCALHLPLVDSCTLIVHMIDHISSDHKVRAFQSWASSNLGGGLTNSIPEITNLYDGVTVQITRNTIGYSAGPRSMRRKLFASKHPPAMVGPNTHKIGFIITSVNADSGASSQGLKPGMELLYLKGTFVKFTPFHYIAQQLASIDDDTVEAIFSPPVRANTYVTVRGKDGISKKRPFTNQGMILEPLHGNRATYGRDGPHWYGFRDHDEIITINDDNCYEALGDSRAGFRLLEHCWKDLRKNKIREITFGVNRLSGGDPPPGLQCFLGSPSVFRYARGTQTPHLSSPFLVFRPSIDESFSGVAWVSHCGLVFSIQSSILRETCLGIYIDDIHLAASVVEVHAYAAEDSLDEGKGTREPHTPKTKRSAATPPPSGLREEPSEVPSEVPSELLSEVPSEVPLVLLHDSHEEKRKLRVNTVPVTVPRKLPDTVPVIDSDILATVPDTVLDTEVDIDIGILQHGDMNVEYKGMFARAASCYRLSLSLQTKGDKSANSFEVSEGLPETTSELHIESEFEFRLHLIGVTLASLKNATSISTALGHAGSSFNDSGESLPTHDIHSSHHNWKGSLAEVAKFTAKESATNRWNECKNSSDKSIKKYWLAYNRYLQLFAPARDGKLEKHEAMMAPKQVAQILAYQQWPKRKLAFLALHREQIAPKLLKHLPPITRAERWATLVSAINTSFFFMTLLFQAECSTEPKPAICDAKKRSFVERLFEPSWNTVATTIFGLCLSVPMPLILLTCFRKTPVLEQMTPAEKKLRIRTWRFWQAAGWTLVIGANVLYIYWLTVFSNHFPEAVLVKVLSAAMLMCIHRFISAPVIRGCLFGLILFLSRLGSCCDIVLVLCPQIFLIGKLDSFDPGEIDFMVMPSGFAAAGFEVDFDI
jgi:hypothetical protein